MHNLRAAPFFILLALPFFLASTCRKTTPAAATFATLQAAAAAIDDYRTRYEAAAVAGQITPAQKQECDARFTKANEAIIVAARAARDGLNANTPDEVTQAVNSLIQLVVFFLPPPGR